MTAFLYAGQGSQKVGMGRDFYERFDIYRELIDAAPRSDIIRRISFGGPAAELSLTRHTQPCMVTFAAGVTALLRERGIRPDMAAGLSLGEYSALHAAGVLTARQAVELAWLRGEAMERASEGIDCKMAAIIGGDEQLVREACAQGSGFGIVGIANLNCPEQVVISGERTAVEAAEAAALALGAKRALPLDVSGPFHTALMAPAGEALSAAFSDIQFGDMRLPVVFNATGELLAAGESIPELLVRQVSGSVYFERGIRTMLACGADTFVEIGPGRALSGFVKRIDSGVKTIIIEDMPTLEAAIKELEGA